MNFDVMWWYGLLLWEVIKVQCSTFCSIVSPLFRWWTSKKQEEVTELNIKISCLFCPLYAVFLEFAHHYAIDMFNKQKKKKFHYGPIN